MSATMLLHECQQRGLNLWVDGEKVRCRGKSDVLTPEFTQLIRRYKTDLLILLTESSPHSTPSSPHGSPHKTAEWTSHRSDVSHEGSEGYEACHQTKTSDSPPSPHDFGEETRAKGNFNSGSLLREGENGNCNTHVGGSPHLVDGGLGGLTGHNPDGGHEVTSSPHGQNAWTSGGLTPAEGGLQPAYHPFFDAVVPLDELEAGPWSCRNVMCLDKSRGWWLSIHGVLNCLNCCRPQSPDLVVRQGDATDTPTTEPGRSSTPLRV